MKNKTTFRLLTSFSVSLNRDTYVQERTVLLPIGTNVSSALGAGSNSNITFVYGNYPTKNESLSEQQEFHFLLIKYDITLPVSLEMDEEYIHLNDVRMAGDGYALYYKKGKIVES